LPTYFEAKSKIIPVKMYLSTVLNPWFMSNDN
jgi:hypothetical protein